MMASETSVSLEQNKPLLTYFEVLGNIINNNKKIKKKLKIIINNKN